MVSGQNIHVHIRGWVHKYNRETRGLKAGDMWWVLLPVIHRDLTQCQYYSTCCTSMNLKKQTMPTHPCYPSSQHELISFQLHLCNTNMEKRMSKPIRVFQVAGDMAGILVNHSGWIECFSYFIFIFGWVWKWVWWWGWSAQLICTFVLPI